MGRGSGSSLSSRLLLGVAVLFASGLATEKEAFLAVLARASSQPWYFNPLLGSCWERPWPSESMCLKS